MKASNGVPAVVLWLAFAPAVAAADTPPASPAAPLHKLSLDNKPWTGDFDGMLERRNIRVLVPYSRTLYFIDKGRERGVTADLMREFERYLNTAHASQLGHRPLTIILIPTTRDKLLSGVVDGLGDIAAANLTATESRRAVVDFVAPSDQPPVNEVLVTGPSSPPVATLQDLAGRTVPVRRSSSYYESLVAFNAAQEQAGRPPVTIATVPEELEDEDEFEMLNAGLLPYVVADAWKAQIWAQVLPKIRVRNDLVLHAGGAVGWAIRKDSPGLSKEIDAFYRKIVRKQGELETLQERYLRQIRQITNNTAGAAMQRFKSTLELFKKYGARYGFDPLMLAAQGYQESKLDQGARSEVGAVGVMQLMPATGKELKVGDITLLEPNIHAGTKYMSQLMTKYFPDAHFTDADRPLFAFASYNAGPGTIAKMRSQAAGRGLDPDQWFDNVEVVVAERVGLETTTYVRNIFKYYVAYTLTLQSREAAQRARDTAASAHP